MREFLICMLLLIQVPVVLADETLRQKILAIAAVGLDANFDRKIGDYTEPVTSIADQLSDILGGPPDEPIRLSKDVYFFSACRLHSCDEKGAVIVDVERRGLLVGTWRHFHCRRDGAQFTCDRTATLSTFYFAGWKQVVEPTEKARYADQLQAWATALAKESER